MTNDNPILNSDNPVCVEIVEVPDGSEFDYRKEFSEDVDSIRGTTAEGVTLAADTVDENGQHPTPDELLAFASPQGYPGIPGLELKRVDEITDHLKECDDCYKLYRGLDNM